MMENSTGPAQRLEWPVTMFVEALKDAVATMAGITMESVDESFLTGEATMGGMMVLQGDPSAVLMILADQPSVAAIVTNMTGIDSGELTIEDLRDGLSELVNMVAGTVRGRLTGSGNRFKLSSPLAVTGEHLAVYAKRHVECSLSRFVAGDIWLELKIFYI